MTQRVDFSNRSTQEEIMDDLHCSGDILNITLHELEVINKLLGGNAVTINALNKLTRRIPRGKTLHIADLGCGSGDMLKLISRWALKNGREVMLTGIDANPNTVAYAQHNVRDHDNIRIRLMDIFSPEFGKEGFDIVIGTLFFHHFSTPDLIGFFKTLRKSAAVGVIINDIHRHMLAYHSIKWLTALFSKSTMVKNDAPVSVLRAFTRKEIEHIVVQSGFSSYSIAWKWAFRWQVIMNTNESRK